MTHLVSHELKLCGGMYHEANINFAAMMWEDLQYQIDYQQTTVRRRKIMPYPRFTKAIIHRFMSQHKSISKREGLLYQTIVDDGLMERLKFVNKGDIYQVYGKPILDTWITDEIKKYKAYNMYFKYSTGLITLKRVEVEQHRSDNDDSDDEEEDDKSTNIKQSDNKKTDSDTEDHVMGKADMDTDQETTKENIDEELKGDDQATDAQPKDDQIRNLDSVSHKDKPKQEVPNAMQEPYHVMKVSVIPESTQSPPPPLTPLLTTTEIPEKVLKKRDREDDKEEDPSAGPNQGKETKKRKTGKEAKSSRNSLKSKQSTKVKPSSKSSKTGKSASADQTVQEPKHNVQIDVKEPTFNNVENDADEPQVDPKPRSLNPQWFTQPPRPETPDPDWNTIKTIDDAQEQPWFNERINAKKPPLTFNELMSTPIDFLHSLCIVSNQLDWINPEGYDRPVDMNKPLPLQKKGYRLIIPIKVFFNNDLEYLKRDKSERTYSYSITKTPTARRADQKLYKFKEGDFPDLHLNVIEDMLLLLTQTMLFNLEGDVIIDLGVALRMFTRGIILNQSRRDLPKDIQIVSIEVLRYDIKGVKVRMGIMQTKTELTLEQTQQGVRNEVFDSILQAGNSCQIESPLKEILPDHMSVLIDSKVHVKMEMEIPHSSRVKFITACSYSIKECKDIMKAQVRVSKVFRYSDTQSIFLEVNKCSS
nr:hypothetical protein [Tanacetum cinerariifolium]